MLPWAVPKSSTAAPPPLQDDKAARILAAATAVFSRYGFRRAAIDDVAREAGVAKGTVYLYYESKEALFRAVAQDFADRMLAGAASACATRAPVPERLRRVLEAKFLYVYDVVTRSAHASELLDARGRLAARVFDVTDRQYQARLASVLEEGVAAGQLDLSRAELTPATAAAFLIRAGHGLATPDPSGSLPSRETLKKRIAELVRVALEGLRVAA